MGKVLDLVLREKWYDMIASGEKKEEYREIKPFYANRFSRYSYDTVRLRRGYTSTVITRKIKSIKKGIGKPEWGAPSFPVFIISLEPCG